MMATGTERIERERARQIEAHGYTPEHDDEHSLSELWHAACAYALRRPESWPWEPDEFKLGDRQRELEKAGALFLAVRDFAQRRADVVAEKLDRLAEEEPS